MEKQAGRRSVVTAHMASISSRSRSPRKAPGHGWVASQIWPRPWNARSVVQDNCPSVVTPSGLGSSPLYVTADSHVWGRATCQHDCRLLNLMRGFFLMGLIILFFMLWSSIDGVRVLMFSCLFSSWISCSPSCVKWPCKFTRNLPAMKISSWCLLFQLVPYAVQLNKLTMEPKCWSSECRLLQVLCVVRVTFAAKAEKRTSRHCFCRQGVWSDPLIFLVLFLQRAWKLMHRSALQTFWPCLVCFFHALTTY